MRATIHPLHPTRGASPGANLGPAYRTISPGERRRCLTTPPVRPRPPDGACASPVLLTRVDKPALLRRLFDLACRCSGRILSYNKMLGQLQDAGNTTTLAHDLESAVGAHLANAQATGACQGQDTDRH